MHEQPLPLIKIAERAIREAAERGGECLAKACDGLRIKVKWRCIRGHTWSMTPAELFNGHWCPMCAGKPHVSGRSSACKGNPVSMNELQAIARHRGGKCLNSIYTGPSQKLSWQCKDGHQWQAAVRSVVYHGTWCPTCARRAKLLTMADLQEIARARGGECLNWSRGSAHELATWKCKEGHEWMTEVRNVIRGSWCPTCMARAKLKPRVALDQLKAMARAQGGACLSNQYVNASTKLRWRCKYGHEWDAIPRSIILGSWCRACALPDRGKQSNLDRARTIAAGRGGKCLSTWYPKRHYTLVWQCSEGHEWRASLPDVARGAWCQVCADNANRMTMQQQEAYDDLADFARTLDGKLVSPAYVDHETPLEWRCERYHKFTATSAQVRDGLWCPTCDPASWEKVRTPASVEARRFTGRTHILRGYPSGFSNGGKPARHVLVHQIDERKRVVAELLVSRIIAILRRKEIIPLSSRQQRVFAAYKARECTAHDVLSAIYPSEDKAGFLEVTTPSRRPMGWAAISLPSHHVAHVDLVLDEPYATGDLATTIWTYLANLSRFFLFDGEHADTEVTKAYIGNNTPLVIKRFIERAGIVKPGESLKVPVKKQTPVNEEHVAKADLNDGAKNGDENGESEGKST
nr:hypothetical protein [Candidatus Sigynarchaeota archaeon]